MQDVAKCSLTECDKYNDCMYGQSKLEIVYDFKHYCCNNNKYIPAYNEGQSFRDTIAEEVEKIGN